MIKYRRLKDLRENRDYIQDYIANILKTNRSSYANWENGETLIPLDKLDQLSVFYNVPISYLLGIKNNYNRYKNIGKMNYNLMLDKLNQLKDNLSLTYQEIGDYLKVSKSTAYREIKKMNEELKKKGYITISGKIPIKYFKERLYC